jgi:nitroreductase
MLLSMQNLGLAGCWVGAFDEMAVKRILNIPAHIQVEALIPIGYELEKEKITELKERKDTYKIFYLEKWGVHYALQTKRIEAL